MKIKQAEIRAWVSGAIREAQRLNRDADNTTDTIISRARLEVLEAVEEACCGRLSDLQALAGQGAQSAIGGGVICG